MYLGIEIGGTKLQLAIGSGDGSELVALERLQVDPSHGADGIRRQIERTGCSLLEQHTVTRIGIGFGGPVNVARGQVTKSHQISGWDGFPLVAWCERVFGVATQMDNDCNVAALAEAQFGAGRDQPVVFYVTVGTGVGGGLVIDGKPFGTRRPAVAEIGHLRPGLPCANPDATVESLASGWGIVAQAHARLRHAAQESSQDGDYADLRTRCGGDLRRMTAEIVSQAAGEGNSLARDVLDHAIEALGWAIAQVITVLAPHVVVVGGGVAKMGAAMFFEPLRTQVRRYVFPPLCDTYQIVPSTLCDRVVIHGALALAAQEAD